MQELAMICMRAGSGFTSMSLWLIEITTTRRSQPRLMALVIMNYDQHQVTSAPGPVAPRIGLLPI